LEKAPTRFQSVKRMLARFFQDRSGATAMEYSLIVALIGATLVITMGAIGTQLRDDVFGAVNSSLSSIFSE